MENCKNRAGVEAWWRLVARASRTVCGQHLLESLEVWREQLEIEATYLFAEVEWVLRWC